MKAVLLAGGLGTRISEESTLRPKPMIEIGAYPILWHIMKIYACHGITDFIVCCGYKGHMIKQYFSDYFLFNSDMTFNFRLNQTVIHKTEAEPWTVTCVDTGESTMTGGRLKRVKEFVEDETFCLTYGDGVSDVDISASIAFHKSHGKLATLTAVQPVGRFGAFSLQAGQNTVEAFHEKPKGDGAWVNGGFFVLEPGVFDFIEGDSAVWEREPMEMLARSGNLQAWKHVGFWQPMDTLRDKTYLEDLWAKGNPPWKAWKNGVRQPAENAGIAC
ncbi:MAG TPA: glucose-1-phosphate cytidylyltransferase [Chthoniobacterales bacterium]